METAYIACKEAMIPEIFNRSKLDTVYREIYFFPLTQLATAYKSQEFSKHVYKLNHVTRLRCWIADFVPLIIEKVYDLNRPLGLPHFILHRLIIATRGLIKIWTCISS